MPAPQPPPWPRNAWYVAAMANEVQDRPLGRQICGERIVFFRGPDRTVAAVEDFCPHRGAALSLGFLREGALVCGYHGLSLGCDGWPVGMPGQRVERFPAIRAYPALERYGFIWVWPGEPHLADTTKLSRLDWAESDDWRYGGDLFHVCCDYRLMIDNLMDLSHETYVHANSIGQKEIDEAPVITTEQGT